MWSNTDMSMILPASTSFFVMEMSSCDGSGFPDGWLWAKIILAHVETIAPLYTSLAWTRELFNNPSEITSNPVTTFALLSQITTNRSLTSPSNKNGSY